MFKPGLISLSLLMFLVSALRAEEPQRVPVPDAAQQRESQKLVRTLFKEEFTKRTPQELAAQPAKWLKYASETKDDPAARYVLLCQARDQAAVNGNFEVALQSVYELYRQYDVDPSTDTAQVLNKMAGAVHAVEVAKSLAMLAHTLADDAYRADQFNSGDRLLAAAESAALKSRDVATLTSIRTRKKSAQLDRLSYAPAATAMKTLATMPNDPAANTALGRYECFNKRKWDSGLVRLTKGNDPTLRDTAAADLAAQDTPSQLRAAHNWWVYGKVEVDPIKGAALSRAVHWYVLNLPNLTGPQAKEAEDRIQEYQKSYGKPTQWVVLFRSDNPAVWNTNTTFAPNYAVPIDRAPAEMKYVRLKRMDTGETLIIPLTRSELGNTDVAPNRPFRWNGANVNNYGGHHLGIGQGGLVGEQTGGPGKIGITIVRYEVYVGSGFGHKYGGDGRTQCYCWKGQEIPKTVFEISVTADSLDETERRQALTNFTSP